ncbi:MAG TPA: type II secretion system F family protein [Patescibacteria group bacterium]|nr:type II secretion system F family protein [Patescibacteria group bacterium]
MEFQYTACDKSGKRIKAIEKADALALLVSRLKNQGLTPLSISEVKQAQNSLDAQRRTWFNRVKRKELAVFSRQLASILHAGILLTEALHTIAEDMENQYFKHAITRIVEDVNAGTSFSSALARYPDIFPATYLAVIKAGEAVGNLAATTTNLAKYLEDYERMREKFRSALMYPVFLSSFLVFVVTIIVVFIIPRFKQIFAQAGARLPLLTRIVVGVSEFCLKNAPAALFVVAIGVMLSCFFLKIPKIRYAFDARLLRVPQLGKLIRKALIARFCRTFSVLLGGGVGIATSLVVSGDVVSNSYLRHLVGAIKNAVVSGVALADAMKPHQTFPRIVVKMVAIGEKSGKLDDMLRRSAEYYDQELETTLNNFSSLIEPVFIVLIGGVVLTVVLALYLPIFKIASAVR